MKRLLALTAGIFLSVFLTGSVYAASDGNPGSQSDQQVQQDKKTGKQAAKTWHDRDKKWRANQKLAAEKRQQELSSGSTNEDKQMTMK